MDIVLINAMSISIGIGSDFGMNNGGSGLPVVSLNFPAPFALELVDNLFQPHARPEHFLFGINDQGKDTVEVALYFLADLIPSVALPLAASLSGAIPTGPALYLIGTEADIKRRGVENFLIHQALLGKYFAVCGNQTAIADQFTPAVGNWRMELKKTHPLEEIRRIVWEKVR